MNEEEYIKASGIDHTARRIELKRLEQRRKKIDKAVDSGTIMIMFIIAGLMIYAAFEFKSGIKSDAHPMKVQASESKIDQRTKNIYDCFATVGTSSLKLSLPGKIGSVVAVGFHQADRREAVAQQPAFEYFDRETTATVAAAIQKAKSPVLFIMASRGRGSSLTSAADVAMKVGSDVYSPVDGIVRKVCTYNLYGKLMDNHIEIEPDGYPDLRVAIIHIYNVRVTVGQRVTRQTTCIATMRPLPQIQSQINKYLPETADHVHMQINPATVKGKMKS
jgi:hypothetical protein